MGEMVEMVALEAEVVREQINAMAAMVATAVMPEAMAVMAVTPEAMVVATAGMAVTVVTAVTSTPVARMVVPAASVKPKTRLTNSPGTISGWVKSSCFANAEIQRPPFPHMLLGRPSALKYTISK